MNVFKKIMLYPNIERDLRTFDYRLVWIELCFRAFSSIFISFITFNIVGNSWIMYLITIILVIWIFSFLFITKEHFEANDT